MIHLSEVLLVGSPTQITLVSTCFLATMPVYTWRNGGMFNFDR